MPAISYPRQFVRSSECEAITRFRAPLIGEHNSEVYGEIGLSGSAIDGFKRSRGDLMKEATDHE